MTNPDAPRIIAEFERVTAYFKPKPSRPPTEQEKQDALKAMAYIETFKPKEEAVEQPAGK